LNFSLGIFELLGQLLVSLSALGKLNFDVAQRIFEFLVFYFSESEHLFEFLLSAFHSFRAQSLSGLIGSLIQHLNFK
jgi:hypothetical protein